MIQTLRPLALTAQARWFAAALFVVVLVYWIVRRLLGNSTDASIRSSSSTSTGSASILLSGTMAFAAVAIGAAVLLAPEIMSSPVLGVALLALVTVGWLLNKQEVAT
jgi:uncharacterized membrane protein